MEKIKCPKCNSYNVKDLGEVKKADFISKIVAAINWAASGCKSKHNFECLNCRHKFISEKESFLF